MNANTLPPGAKHIAACHSAASCSAFGSFVMYLPAPRTLKDAAAHIMAFPKLSGDHAASQAREILRICGENTDWRPTSASRIRAF
jgi:hypothetical protein